MSRRNASARFSNDLRYRGDAHPNQRQLTPAYVLEPVREALGGCIDLDPCTEAENPTDASKFFTEVDDGAARPWSARSIFVNPPYSKARERWVERCIEAGEAGSRVVLLVPAATDTRIFQRAINTASALVLIKGRVKFGILRDNGRQQAASHPSALIGWNLSLAPCAHLGTCIPLWPLISDPRTAPSAGSVTPAREPLEGRGQGQTSGTGCTTADDRIGTGRARHSRTPNPPGATQPATN